MHSDYGHYTSPQWCKLHLHHLHTFLQLTEMALKAFIIIMAQPQYPSLLLLLHGHRKKIIYLAAKV